MEAKVERTPSVYSADDTVLFAIPKKGRIYEEVMSMLKGAGLDAKRPDRLDVATCKELPIKLVFLPAKDIPSYVMDGDVDLGISGEDVLQETLVGSGYDTATHVVTLLKLGIGKCKLCLQAPQALGATDPAVFTGKRIVTSFPAITRKYFDDLEAKVKKDGSFSPPGRLPKTCSTNTTIKEVSGSVEAACGLGLADAVVDLVETGTTMHAAGLEVVGEPIFESEFLIFQQLPSERNGLREGPKAEIVKTILSRLQGYLTATRYVMIVYNCHDDNLIACCGITPGKRSPTVTELKEDGWHSVSALVQKSTCNTIMDKLNKAGATDILCLPLQNTRM